MQLTIPPAAAETVMPGKISRPLLVLLLVVVADVLLFDRTPGINFFLFSLTVTLAILASRFQRLSSERAGLLLAFSLTASLPLAESASLTATFLAFLAITFVAMAASNLVPPNTVRLATTMGRFYLSLPGRLFKLFEAGRGPHPASGKIWERLRVWILPILLTAGFLALFSMANPLIEIALGKIDLELLLEFLNIWRIAFWLMAAAAVYVMLRPRLRRFKRRAKAERPRPELPPKGVFGEASLKRSFVLFNLLFALETVLDLTYLWGGAELPAGMSYAEYAHRGAYPLVVTALLAALFVLFAMRKNGPGDKSLLIRRLVYAWIGQNVLLCFSAILRLYLYVETYSLTELRVAAGIWMGLVAAGLVLIMLRIAYARSNEWLVSRSLAMLLATFYFSAVADISAFIARFNVAHCSENSRKGLPLDLSYLRSLGPAVIPALDTFIETAPKDWLQGKRMTALNYRNDLVQKLLAEKEGQDWRSWSFREERLVRYVQATETIVR